MFRVLFDKNQSDDPNATEAREVFLISVGGLGAVFLMWAIALVGVAA